MPGVRESLTTREASRRAQHGAEMAESERRWKYAKALKKAVPMSLFNESAFPSQGAR